MSNEDHKVFMGIRLSKDNMILVERVSDSLGLNKTSTIELILTVIRKDEKLLAKLIQKALIP
ncbi:MAG: hypothetical protein A2033_05105 [Bacteroidetes bacterium GWA2_31_9]|nr:MAG: hypothetical protein A2033_05105 [Bacteroidetes bacterium GWA2_31_9]